MFGRTAVRLYCERNAPAPFEFTSDSTQFPGTAEPRRSPDGRIRVGRLGEAPSLGPGDFSALVQSGPEIPLASVDSAY